MPRSRPPCSAILKLMPSIGLLLNGMSKVSRFLSCSSSDDEETTFLSMTSGSVKGNGLTNSFLMDTTSCSVGSLSRPISVTAVFTSRSFCITHNITAVKHTGNIKSTGSIGYSIPTEQWHLPIGDLEERALMVARSGQLSVVMHAACKQTKFLLWSLNFCSFWSLDNLQGFWF